MSEMRNPISYHIFLFIFKWDLNNCYWNDLIKQSFLQRTSLHKLKAKYRSNLIKDSFSWTEYKFNIEEDLNKFNERAYFLNNVEQALFANGTGEESKVQFQLNYDKTKLFQYKIFLKDREGPLELCIDDITLNYYSSGIGILGFHLENIKHESFEDVLLINDFGRRIYPQFLQSDQTGLSKTEAIKSIFLADKIVIEFDSLCVASENFDYYNNLHNLSKETIVLPEFISKVFNFGFESLVNKKNGLDEYNQGTIIISPLLDDRMFTICWHGNDTISKNTNNYELDSNWYRFLFVDGKSKGIANQFLETELLLKHTYSRWAEYSTVYGVSRYSFMILSNESIFSKSILISHLQTVYFQMIMLCLVQKASLFRFSQELAFLKLRSNTKIINEVQEKYFNYLNYFEFQNITSQEQGIELYQLIRDKFEIVELRHELSTQLTEFVSYGRLEKETQTNYLLFIFTIASVFFGICSFIVGYYGMNMFDIANTPKDVLIYDYLPLKISISILLIFAFIFLLFYFRRKRII